MKELYIEAAKKHNLGIIMTPTDFLLKVIDLKMKAGQQQLTEEDMEQIYAVLNRHMGNTLHITLSDFMGREIMDNWLDSEAGDHESRRYLLVNGLIPYTEENIKGLPMFYLDAEHLPPELASQLLEKVKGIDGEPAEEYELDQHRSWDSKLNGAWIEDGRISSIKTSIKLNVDLERIYNISLE